MRLVIFYRNQPQVRQAIEQWLLESVQEGEGFSVRPTFAPFFQARAFWPSYEELMHLPLSVQVEEVEVTAGKVVSLRTAA